MPDGFASPTSAANLLPFWASLRNDHLQLEANDGAEAEAAHRVAADQMFQVARAIEEAPCVTAADAAARLAVAIETLRILTPPTVFEDGSVQEGWELVEAALQALIAAVETEKAI